MAFVRRRIDITITLGTGSFGQGGEDTVKLTGLRVSVKIINAGGPSMGTAQVAIFGLTPSQLNKLSSLTPAIMYQRKNSILIEAGDDQTGMSAIFQGGITVGWADLNASPDSILNLMCQAGIFEAIAPAAPSSYPGSADIAVIMQNLATSMGLAFENNGVSVILSTQYLAGTLRDQALRAAEAAGINWTIDNGTLAIWPQNGARGGQIPVVSPETGMVGYPAYNGNGVDVTTIFMPTLKLGGLVQIKSSLMNANGTFPTFSIVHDLESEMPGGQWFSHFQAAVVAGVSS